MILTISLLTLGYLPIAWLSYRYGYRKAVNEINQLLYEDHLRQVERNQQYFQQTGGDAGNEIPQAY